MTINLTAESFLDADRVRRKLDRDRRVYAQNLAVEDFGIAVRKKFDTCSEDIGLEAAALIQIGERIAEVAGEMAQALKALEFSSQSPINRRLMAGLIADAVAEELSLPAAAKVISASVEVAL